MGQHLRKQLELRVLLKDTDKFLRPQGFPAGLTKHSVMAAHAVYNSSFIYSPYYLYAQHAKVKSLTYRITISKQGQSKGVDEKRNHSIQMSFIDMKKHMFTLSKHVSKYNKNS